MKKTILFLLLCFIFVPIQVCAKASNQPEEEFANLVFFAYYKGTPAEEAADKKYLKEKTNTFLELYNGESPRSFTNYLKTVSYQKFHVKNIFPQLKNGVIEPFLLDMDIQTSYRINVDSQIIDKIVAAYPSIASQLDYNQDGYVDNVTIIVKSREGYSAASQSTMISHKADYPGMKRYAGKYISAYNIVGTASIENTDSGVLVHEFLHTIGYPDLYRSDEADDYPVYTWDIMASANSGMSYPLAFLRSEISHWIDIETVTTSKSLTLHAQDNASGNQAFILKSPLNDYEFFVVEYRKKDYGISSLDRFIGGSGVIVYRVDTTVEKLSNSRGGTGIYVFRPQTGYEDERTRVYNAYLSQESKRTQIGTSDMSKGLSDSALTFSDGSNSGIVIRNVSSANSDSITLDVEVPNSSSFDVWKNTNLPDSLASTSSKTMTIAKYQNKIYSLSYTNGQLHTKVYENNTWKSYTASDLTINALSVVKPIEWNNAFYFVATYNNQLLLYQWVASSNTWKLISRYTETATVNYLYEMDAKVIGDKLYIVGTTMDQAILYQVSGSAIQRIGTYYQSDQEYCGTPRIGNIGNTVYMTTKTINGQILLYRYQQSAIQRENVVINDGTQTNAYDLKSLGNQLYFAFDHITTSDLNVVTYDGSKIERIPSSIKLRFPTMVVSQGNLYVIGTCNRNLYVFAIDTEKKSFQLEGTSVDIGEVSYNTSLESIGSTIYVGISRSDQKIFVKKKEITNRLKEIQLVKPNKTTYQVGEALNKTGMKVSAIYTNGTREVSNYTIANFDTSKTGTFTAHVFYEGMEKTFSYTVVPKIVPNTLISITVTPPTKTTYQVGETLNKTGMKVVANYTNSSTVVTNYTISNFSTAKAGTFTATVTYASKNKTFSYTVVAKPATPTKTLYQAAVEKGYQIHSGFMSRFTIGVSLQTIRSQLNPSPILKANGSIIATGVELTYQKEKYTAVLYGDLNGDGKINSADLLKMRQHLLNTHRLTGAYQEAASITSDNLINSADLLRLRQHLLGTNLIRQ